MENFDWSVVFAGLAVFLSFLGLKFQRNDISKQNKYQRDTFELQNKLEENNLITNISSKMIGAIIIQHENLYRWYTFKHEHQRYKRLFIELQGDYKIGSEEYKDKIAIEELKNLKKEEIDIVAQKNFTFMENYYEMLSALEILLESSENKKAIINELNEIKKILISESHDIALLRFNDEAVPYNEINDWRLEYKKKLDPRIESLKLYFSSSRKELIDEINAIKKELK